MPAIHTISQQSRPLSIVLLFVPLKVRPEIGALGAASLTDETRLQVASPSTTNEGLQPQRRPGPSQPRRVNSRTRLPSRWTIRR
jgi:hypothetical protein